MAQSQKHPLRALSTQEERELHRLVKATSERVDVVRRATALLAVAHGQTFTEAAHQADLKSGDGVGKLVVRFNIKQEARALPIILRHSAGMVLPGRTYILPEAVVKRLRAEGIKFTEIGRDAEALNERGALSGERI